MTQPVADRLLELITGSWKTQAICVAAQLRLAERLAGGPQTSAALAAAAGVDPAALHRLLRALTTLDICAEADDGRFTLTQMGALLDADSPDSLSRWAIYWGDPMWQVWGRLLYSVTTGNSARTLLTGREGFEHLERDPETAALVNQALAELTRLASHSVVQSYDFSGLRKIVDVGGGYGELLAGILNANPAATGVLFERPHAIEGARRQLAAAGLAERCACVAGDFFESVPAGADAYVLKSVLHDWDDSKCGRILANCRRAMAADARLLLIERLVPGTLAVSREHQTIMRSDLHMLVALAARERSEGEFRELLSAAGFGVRRIVPAGMALSVIEAGLDG